MEGVVYMETRLQKWGNSDGIRIPSSLLRSLDLKTNDMVQLTQKDDTIVISKPKKKHLSLDERIYMFDALSDFEKGTIDSYDWGEDLGKERF